MTYLTDEERTAIRSVSLQGRSESRVRRAEALVNPASGLANDYLNLFNEIVMLIEQLPMMPELYEDIQRWRPTSYQDYFHRSILPGRASALDTYARLDAKFRADFEAVVAELDRRATGAVAAVRKHVKQPSVDPDVLANLCNRAGSSIREALDQATMLVNHGELVSSDLVQMRADQLIGKIAVSAPTHARP